MAFDERSTANNLQKKLFVRRKKTCPLSGRNAPLVDYKNIKLLQKFISERGKIVPSRISSVSSAKQRQLSNAIKKARVLALLPFIGKYR